MGLINVSASQALLVSILFLFVLPFFISGRSGLLSENSAFAWSMPLITSVFFVLIDFKGKFVTGGNIRYTGTLFCIAVLVSLHGRTSLGKYSRLLFFLVLSLVMTSISGSLIGRLIDGEMTGALPLAVPMIILIIRLPEIKEETDFRLGSRLLIVLCSFINLETIFVRLNLLPKESLQVFSHEKSFIFFLGLTLAIAIKSRIGIAVNSFLIVVSFVVYPAATFAISLIMVAGTYLVASNKKNFSIALFFSSIYPLLAFLSIFYSRKIFELTTGYFFLVGKANNSQYRESLIQVAVQEISKSPWVGTFFRGSATVQAKVLGNQTYRLPVHNDYITIVLCGGIFFLLFFLVIPIYVNIRTIALIYRLHSSSVRRRILIALLASINVVLATSFANPILINPASSTIFYCLIVTVISLSSPKLNKRIS